MPQSVRKAAPRKYDPAREEERREIGRASCRERV